MKTYHMYHSESISAESKLKEAEKQEEKQIGRADPVFSIRMEEKYQRRSSVKKIEKMKEKVRCQVLKAAKASSCTIKDKKNNFSIEKETAVKEKTHPGFVFLEQACCLLNLCGKWLKSRQQIFL